MEFSGWRAFWRYHVGSKMYVEYKWNTRGGVKVLDDVGHCLSSSFDEKGFALTTA